MLDAFGDNRIDLRQYMAVHSYRFGQGIAQAAFLGLYPLAQFKGSFQFYRQFAPNGTAAKDGLCGILLSQRGIFVGQQQSPVVGQLVFESVHLVGRYETDGNSFARLADTADAGPVLCLVTMDGYNYPVVVAQGVEQEFQIGAVVELPQGCIACRRRLENRLGGGSHRYDGNLCSGQMRDGECVVAVMQQGERLGIEPTVQCLVAGFVQVGHEPLQFNGLLPGQPQRVFVSQNLFAFFVDEPLGYLSLGNGFTNALELFLGVQGIQHDVVTGHEGHQSSVAKGRCPFHLEGVGENQPLESQ